ncbi:hypothetical protein TcWFU_005730 [Taenia crassiceps]|uniref:Uncharacterized protein n=1 Tax=Taenia crassiceps TaxID=6207 RepID=A0ABR4QRC0_9CEST
MKMDELFIRWLTDEVTQRPGTRVPPFTLHVCLHDHSRLRTTPLPIAVSMIVSPNLPANLHFSALPNLWNYQFLALQTIVYWAIVAGHMASGYSLLIGIPLLPLLVVQIILLIHIWTSLVTRHQFHPVEPPSVPSSSQILQDLLQHS